MNNDNTLSIFSGEKLSRNIQILLEKQSLSINELAKYTQIPLTTLKRIKLNDDANPTLSTLVPIANFFSISLNQLVGIDPLPETKVIGEYAQKRNFWTHIPVISWSEVVNWPNENKQTHFPVISTDINVGKNSFSLKVENDDWVNFLPGSFLIIDPTLSPENRDYVVVHKKGQPIATFKELLIDEGNKYLKPLNKDFNTVMMDSNYKIIGVMIQIRADLKSE